MTNAQQTARQDLNNLASFVRRGNLTGWVRDRNARWQFEKALRSVLAVEDAEGIEAAAKLSDRLDSLRREAMERRLLAAGDIIEIESRVCNA